MRPLPRRQRLMLTESFPVSAKETTNGLATSVSSHAALGSKKNTLN
jgi:hypothetical protein